MAASSWVTRDVAHRDRTTIVTYSVLLAVTAAAWVQVVGSMPVDDMAGMQMVMTPTVVDAAAYVSAWGVMMVAMMLPSALPVIGLYAATQRNATSALARTTALAVFLLAYVAVWTMLGLPVYFAGLALMSLDAKALAYAVAGVLWIAGVFQLTPLKQACLRHCRSPLGFMLGHWRAGWRGGLAIGWAHALYCVGCCWGLMVVLVVAGAMGLPWVLLIACVVAVEKLSPRGEWLARLAGVALVLLGAAVVVRPGLAVALRGSM